MRQIIFFFFFSLIFSASAQKPVEQPTGEKDKAKKKVTDYTYKIIPSINNTWCYDVYKNGKMLIHQTNIPGLPGNEGFKKKADAKKVARLVIKKLKSGEMPPSVTVDEMEKLKVL